MKECPKCKHTYLDSTDDCFRCKIQLVVVKPNLWKDVRYLFITILIFVLIAITLRFWSINNQEHQRILKIEAKEEVLQQKVELKKLPESKGYSNYEIYRYIESRIWNLPIGTDSEDALVRQAAKKFGISYEKANDIYIKQVWLEMQR